MTGDAQKLRRTLRSIGLSDPAIDAAWPSWWSDDAHGSSSADAELRFSLARKLGLDPRSLLEDGEPRFVWYENAKFKQVSTETDIERAAVNAFGSVIAASLIGGCDPGPSITGMAAATARKSILANQPVVGLLDLLGLCWGIGVPVVHLRVFPLTAKRMSAMAVKVGGRHAILLGKDAIYPAPIAYYLAHEIGHLALGHLSNNSSLVEFGDPLESIGEDDEEIAADRYALELLTGRPDIVVTTEVKHYNSAQLADSLIRTAADSRVEAGTLGMCFGHATGDWPKVYAAMKIIYPEATPVWNEINTAASAQLDWARVPGDVTSYLRTIMGYSQDGVSGT